MANLGAAPSLGEDPGELILPGQCFWPSPGSGAQPHGRAREAIKSECISDLPAFPGREGCLEVTGDGEEAELGILRRGHSNCGSPGSGPQGWKGNACFHKQSQASGAGSLWAQSQAVPLVSQTGPSKPLRLSTPQFPGDIRLVLSSGVVLRTQDCMFGKPEAWGKLMRN